MDSYQTVQADSHQTVQADSPQTMQVDVHQTLHDFVLNLLTDSDARSAFDLDPEAELRAAGLTDITAADVQDVIPLVVDYVPAYGLATAAPVAGQLGVGPLVTDATDVVGQLQSVAQLSVTSSNNGVDVQAGALGAIAVDPRTVSAGAAVFPGIGVGVGPEGLATDLTGVHDVAHTLDAHLVGAVDTTADPVVGDAVGIAANPNSVLDATDSGLLGTPEGLLGGPLSGTHGQVDGIVSSLGVNDTLGGLGLGDGTGGVVPPVDVPSTVGGVTGTVGGVTGGVTGGVSGDVNGDTSVHGEVSASTGGALGLTDGLL